MRATLRANLQKHQQRHHEGEGVENARDEQRLQVAGDKLLRGLFAGENAVHVLRDVFEGVDEHNGLRLVHEALETHVLRGVSRVYIGVYSSFAAYFRHCFMFAGIAAFFQASLNISPLS